MSEKYPEVLTYLNKRKTSKKEIILLKLDMLQQIIIFMKN